MKKMENGMEKKMTVRWKKSAIARPEGQKKIIKAYADNFAFGRRQPWTH
mgnify:CR=1 FL=1